MSSFGESPHIGRFKVSPGDCETCSARTEEKEMGTKMNRYRRYLLAITGAAIVAVVGTSNTLAAPDRTFTRIDFPGANTKETQAWGIGPSGEIVGNYRSDGRLHGYLLSEGEFTTIDVAGSSLTLANDINARGDIVGGYGDRDQKAHGFLLSGGKLTTIDFPDATFTAALGINSRGDIVGRYFDARKVEHGFLLSGGQFIPIDFPGATGTGAYKINPRGDIVGFYTDAGGNTHGYLLSGDQFTTIDVPGATSTGATGINARGDIVGAYFADAKFHGYLLSGDHLTTIDFPGATSTLLIAINPRGDIVGNFDRISGFVYTKQRSGDHAHGRQEVPKADGVIR
jgi:uncharacterized membrane protein